MKITTIVLCPKLERYDFVKCNNNAKAVFFISVIKKMNQNSRRLELFYNIVLRTLILALTECQQGFPRPEIFR